MKETKYTIQYTTPGVTTWHTFSDTVTPSEFEDLLSCTQRLNTLRRQQSKNHHYEFEFRIVEVTERVLPA